MTRLLEGKHYLQKKTTCRLEGNSGIESFLATGAAGDTGSKVTQFCWRNNIRAEDSQRRCMLYGG